MTWKLVIFEKKINLNFLKTDYKSAENKSIKVHYTI
jgi:hypothetical protein